MRIRRRLILFVALFFVICDGLSWFYSYRIFKTLSPDVLRQESLVQKEVYIAIEQGTEIFHAQLSLNGEWLYKQTGQELALGTSQAYYYLPETDTSGWHTMELPKNWYLDGLNYHGVIWFRKEFRLDPSWQGKSVWLRFAGVDYYAEVWLNGTRLGKHAGYFEPFYFDVTSIVKYGQPNLLSVRVDNPYEEYNAVWPGKKTLIKGIFGQDVARPGQTWGVSGQEYNTGGIWNDIWLEANSFLTIPNMRLSASWTEELPVTNVPISQAAVSLLNVSSSPVEVSLKTSLAPENFQGETIDLPEQTIQVQPGKTDIDLSEVVQTPLLWNTWDRGNPNLYRVWFRAYRQGSLLAENSVLFGFRQVKIGENWTWYLNGKQFFVQGTNYISTQWLSQADRAWFERDLGLIKEANLNFIRLPAHVEPQEFYELADELGLLVWQDFPLQWAYSEAPEFYDEAQRQMEAMLTGWYNHPSIAVWCAHNESPWATGDISKNLPNYDSRQNKQLDETLVALAKSLDPNRYVHLTSGTGDSHVSTGWSAGSWTDYQSLPGQPFVSQFGAQALPNLQAMYRMFEPSQLVYHSGETGTRWEFQGFQPGPTYKVAKIDDGVPGEGVDQALTLIKNSQVYQANLIKFAIENYRRAKFNPMTGVVQYLFTDPWQAITFSVLDYQRQPKLGYESLKSAMQPILPSIQALKLPERLDGIYWVYPAEEEVVVAFWVVNDTLKEYPIARIRWQLTNNDNQVLKEGEVVSSIDANKAAQKHLLRGLQFEPGKYHLQVVLSDGNGIELGTNRFSFELEQPLAP